MSSVRSSALGSVQINGVDVRRARHEEVVELINASGETISLKVVTVRTANAAGAPHSQHHYSTLQMGRTHRSSRGTSIG